MRFIVIDTEGAVLDKSYYAYELGAALFDTDAVIDQSSDERATRLVAGLCLRMNYDVRHVSPAAQRQIRYLAHHHESPMLATPHETRYQSAEVVRQVVLDWIDEYSRPKLYAKGPHAEEMWLFYPDKCSGETNSQKITTWNIDDLARHGVPKYDDIPLQDKQRILARVDWSNQGCVRRNVPDTVVLRFSQEYNHHHSVCECIVFGELYCAILHGITRH